MNRIASSIHLANTKQGRCIVIAAMLTVMQANASFSLDYPHYAYDALYERSTPRGDVKYRMCSDGKGHVRIDSAIPGSDDTSETETIIDYLQNTSTMILTNQKAAWTTNLPLSTDGGPMNEARIKQVGGKSLGSRTIGGYKCHGYFWHKGDSRFESWIGDDIGCTVASETNSASSGKATMKLVKYKKGAPPADVFAVPAGFKVQKIGKLSDLKAK